MNKKTVRIVIAILMLLTVCLYFVSGTYARYTSSLAGEAAVTVAKWAVAFKDESGTTLSNNFDLTFTVAENANVVAGKIAPGTTATAKVIVDLTGTEVAVKPTATVTDSALATIFGDSADNVTVTTSIAGTTSGVIALPEGKAFTSANGQVEVTITLTWTDANTEAFNTSDTAVGIAGDTLTLPVTLVLEQNV